MNDADGRRELVHDEAESSPSGWTRAAAAGLTFRPISEADRDFLYEVYASTRAEELAAVHWPSEQKAAFLDMQFRAQDTDYRRNYPDMDWLVILHRGRPVGRLYLHRQENEHCIVDITFLPEQRGRGLGTALMHDLLDEAAAAGKPMVIYVEKYNPAQRLYRRLGFAPVEETGVYQLMRRTVSAG